MQLLQRLSERCSVVQLLNTSGRELAFKVSCSGGKGGKGRMKREMGNKEVIVIPVSQWGVGTCSIGDLVLSSAVESVLIPLFCSRNVRLKSARAFWCVGAG